MTKTLVIFFLMILVTHSPWGSTSLASFSASEFARSVLAGVTAKIRQFSLVMNCMIISLIWYSISGGWSPTGTFVIPGKSISVRFNTVWERMGRVLQIPSIQKIPIRLSKRHPRWLHQLPLISALRVVYVDDSITSEEKERHWIQNGFASFLYFYMIELSQMIILTYSERHWFTCLPVCWESCHPLAVITRQL